MNAEEWTAYFKQNPNAQLRYSTVGNRVEVQEYDQDTMQVGFILGCFATMRDALNATGKARTSSTKPLTNMKTSTINTTGREMILPTYSKHKVKLSPRQQVERIVRIVALDTLIDANVILGTSRRGPVAEARQVAMYIAVKQDIDRSEILSAFGKKEGHGLIPYTLAKIDDQQETDPKFKERVSYLLKCCQP